MPSAPSRRMAGSDLPIRSRKGRNMIQRIEMNIAMVICQLYVVVSDKQILAFGRDMISAIHRDGYLIRRKRGLNAVAFEPLLDREEMFAPLLGKTEQ